MPSAATAPMIQESNWREQFEFLIVSLMAFSADKGRHGDAQSDLVYGRLGRLHLGLVGFSLTDQQHANTPLSGKRNNARAFVWSLQYLLL